MVDAGKHNILGVMVSATDYDFTVAKIIQAAHERRGFIVAPTAVHGIMEAAFSDEYKYRLNSFDLVVPDGQPVRWALNLMYGTSLAARVYGPSLALQLCAKAEKEHLGIYFYGNTAEVLASLRNNLVKRFPNLQICGMEASQFRQLSLKETCGVSRRILESGASIVIVGLGCPRQEVWAFEYKKTLSVPIITVGGAFGVIAGHVSQAPSWMQRWGLEWFFRLCSEPTRLWHRYVLLNPAYAVLVAMQAVRLKQFAKEGKEPSADLQCG